MLTSTAPLSVRPPQAPPGGVTVACPDARPPAYQAVVGLSRAGWLREFATSYYYRDRALSSSLIRSIAPKIFARIEPKLLRRRDGEIPDYRVRPHPSFDAALALESRSSSSTRHALARWRTRHFDRSLQRTLERTHPGAAVIFSDVGSEHALPFCRLAGIRSILSMVHGDVREEREVIARERENSADFFPIYLGDGPIDARELGWLHDRRLMDLESADTILVPSDHIACVLVEHGTPCNRVQVVPYAADTTRFLPDPDKNHGETCRFLFAGGISQRKGIKYLLEAWRMIRRPGWTLQLLGPMPRNTAPLEPFRDEVEWLGRVGHAEMPRLMAQADVFVFPSLFEGSAVVTYEALACGLPSIVTPEAGSVVRDGIDGYLVPAANVTALAERMERLGRDCSLRENFSHSARRRAEAYGWHRYHDAILAAITV